ncbi:MAG: putative oxidoreductase C-terminal domain-containing protein [Bacteroidales bacterium]
MKIRVAILFITASLLASCGSGGSKNDKSGAQTDNHMVKIMTVDPGHFHAALVQKTMFDQVSPNVYVYAPAGPDLDQHLARIQGYNSRAVNPTGWNEIVYNGDDFFETMLNDRKGNVVVLAGNNLKKTDYILSSVKAGFNVLADKPMVISPEAFPKLEEAFKVAAEKGVLLYDIMTERYEITTMLQKALSGIPEVFGTLQPGTKEDPAVTKVSVHHFSKIVSGSPLIRPAWFFDVEQQGEGIVDVTTHLTDLVQWECFPEQILSKSDVKMTAAKRWPTPISKEEFKGVTGLDDYPGYLAKDVKDGVLNVFANGEMIYQLKGIWAKVSVEWKYKAPEGGGDTHFSVMKGSNCDLVIRQTSNEKFVPTLYVENVKGNIDEFMSKLKSSVASLPYDSLTVDKLDAKTLRVNIPAKYRVGHEEHFGQVMSRYLEYLGAGKLPEWEVPNMITKYYTTTEALKLARSK